MREQDTDSAKHEMSDSQCSRGSKRRAKKCLVEGAVQKLDQSASFPEDKIKLCSHRSFLFLATITCLSQTTEDQESRWKHETTDDKGSASFRFSGLWKTSLPEALESEEEDRKLATDTPKRIEDQQDNDKFH